MLEQANALVDHFFRHEYGRIVSKLTRALGLRELDFAEDCVQTAMLRAIRSWPQHGFPSDPAAWLYTVSKNVALDSLRQRKRHQSFLEQQSESSDTDVVFARESVDEVLSDDHLRMLFLCADPDIPLESRLALTLKIAAGFSVSEIARALLVSEATIQKRITRAKERWRRDELATTELSSQSVLERLDDVRLVVYLLFNEGYLSTSHEVAMRRDLCEEAIRLTLLLDSSSVGCGPATSALLALMFFHSARFEARCDGAGGHILLEDQDRGTWDWGLIRRGMRWMTKSIDGRIVSRFHLESAIAWEHCRAQSFLQTDWKRVVDLYRQLATIVPGPTILVSLAFAESQAYGVDFGIQRLEEFPATASESELAQRDTLQACLNERRGERNAASMWFQSALDRDISPSHRVAIEQLRHRYQR